MRTMMHRHRQTGEQRGEPGSSRTHLTLFHLRVRRQTGSRAGQQVAHGRRGRKTDRSRCRPPIVTGPMGAEDRRPCGDWDRQAGSNWKRNLPSPRAARRMPLSALSLSRSLSLTVAPSRSPQSHSLSRTTWSVWRGCLHMRPPREQRLLGFSAKCPDEPVDVGDAGPLKERRTVRQAARLGRSPLVHKRLHAENDEGLRGTASARALSNGHGMAMRSVGREGGRRCPRASRSSRNHSRPRMVGRVQKSP